MIDLADWLPDVVPHVSGCPESTVIREIRNAVEEFCQRSQVWTIDQLPIPTVKGVADYRLDLPDTANIAGFVSMRHIDRMAPLMLRTARELDVISPDWRTLEGVPAHFVQLDRDTILLDRIPSETRRKALWGTLALKPAIASTEIEDLLYLDWRLQIADGAIANLLIIPGKSWSNPQLSMEHKKRFWHGINLASLKARYGVGNRELSVKMRRNY